MQNAENHHPSTTEAVGKAVGSDSIAFSANIDVLDDAVVRATNIENRELTLSGRGLEKKSTLGSSPVRNIATSRIGLLTSLSKPLHPSKFGRTKSLAAQALKGLKFIGKSDGSAGWDAVEKRFDDELATNGLLPRSRFGECIGMTEKSNPRGVKMNEESKDFAGELFDALARRRNITGGLINKAQLKQFWDQISDQNFDSRLQTFFDMVDKNEDGRITVEEVREIISLSASANKLSNIQEQADEYAAFIMEELDTHNLGHIMIENLEMFLLQASNQSVGVGESKNLRPMLSQKLMPIQEPNPRPRRWYQDFKYLLLDNWQRIWVMALWIGVMAGLFAYKYVQYKNKAAYEVMGHCVCMAKGAAETLKLNMALILLPVCRNTITWLRNKTRLGVAVPFDDNFDFHKIIAFAVAIGVGIHAISHLACDFPRLLHASPEKYEPMKPFFGEQPTSYWHFVKGVEGVTGIIMVVLMSIAFTLATRRSSKIKVPKILNKVDFISVMRNKVTGFNAFWYSHHIFVIVYALLIVHGIKLYLAHDWYKKTTWMYIAIPVTLYAGERLIRSSRSRIDPVKILKVGVYPGDVLALHLSKPQGFKYKSGQYIFVKCVSVSPFEWHPFSITSAPRDDYISVHIRSIGDWTRQIRKVFSEVFQLPLSGKSGLLTVDYSKEENNPSFPRVLIDGPYGAPAQDYKKYEVVVLVGLGIGATPMISILKDIVNNMQLAKDEENNALADGSESEFKTRKAYFYWVTKDQGSFEWFKGIMNEVAEMDQEEVIEMHNHCTSVYEEGDARSAFITMLQSLYYAKNGVDIVSGTRVKCYFARPDWPKVYQHIATNNTNTTVGVFLCGSQGKDLRQLALEFSHKTSTKFDFHKENF